MSRKRELSGGVLIAERILADDDGKLSPVKAGAIARFEAKRPETGLSPEKPVPARPDAPSVKAEGVIVTVDFVWAGRQGSYDVAVPENVADKTAAAIEILAGHFKRRCTVSKIGGQVVRAKG